MTGYSGASAAKRSGAGMSSASSATTRVTTTRPSTAGSRTTTPSTGPAQPRRAQSSATTTSANKSKRSGTGRTKTYILRRCILLLLAGHLDCYISLCMTFDTRESEVCFPRF